MSLYVGKSKFGRGVFSDTLIRKGQIVEKCPVIPLTVAEYKAILVTKVENYVYTWPGPRQSADTHQDNWSSACIALGYGSLYNHSDDPNCAWLGDIPNLQFIFKALKAIQPHEEILHNYYWPDWKRKEIGIE